MKRKNAWTMRVVALLAVLVAVTAVIATFVVAKYLKNADVENSLSPAKPEDPPIEEEFDGEEKKNVHFWVDSENNRTEYPVYFRVALVITWKNEEGIVHYIKPEVGVDYRLDLNLDEEDETYGGIWTLEDDGYYYYDKVVESGGRTSDLIKYCAPLDTANAPEGYTLSVEIIVQTVQAVGWTDDDEYEAWQDAWEKFGSSSETTSPSDPSTDPTENP